MNLGSARSSLGDGLRDGMTWVVTTGAVPVNRATARSQRGRS